MLKKPLTLLTSLAVGLLGCTYNAHNYQLDDNLDDNIRTHPATKRFIQFAKASKSATNFEELTAQFYLEQTQAKIKTLKGWYRFTYSAAFDALNKGTCQTIKLKEINHQTVQIDCIGTMIVKSIIYKERTEHMHLRSYMILNNEEWYLDKSGLVQSNTVLQPATFLKKGMKFESPLEKVEHF